MKRKHDHNIEFGRRLKRFRLGSRLSVDVTAKASGVAASTYREWENGRAISGQPYLHLAKVFNVSLNTLFGVNENQRTEIFPRLQQMEGLIDQIKSFL